MSQPFVAEIRIVGFSFAPRGWATCDGQLLPISQNTALFALLGTMYGGNGTTTFGLPNFQGSAPIHRSFDALPNTSVRAQGETGGVDSVTLISAEMPTHTHNALRYPGGIGSTDDPTGSIWGNSADRVYAGPTIPAPVVTMNFQSLAIAGSSFPHNNMPPYLVLNFIIAMQGIFPARS